MPHSTTGTVAMWNGTKDGEEGYIDWATKATNLKLPQNVKVVAEDIRSMPVPPSLMTTGFQLIKAKSSLTPEQFMAGDTPEGKKVIEEIYFPEVHDIVAKMTGSTDIYTTSFKTRKQNTKLDDIGTGSLNQTSLPIVHVDSDDVSAVTNIRAQIGEEKAERIMSYKNWCQVNIWRPINCQVQKWPLLFVEQSRIPDWHYKSHMATMTTKNDPRFNSLGFRAKPHETLLLNDERYLYRYASKMELDEALVFFSFHSDAPLSIPHSAFWDDSSAEDAKDRQSIEVRSWVGYN